MNAPEQQQSGGIAVVVAWAAFLACSWTWCIGMFLPMLLLRDYGLWGFAVFAAPNIIGAAAVGWLFRTRDSAAEFLHTHRFAIAVFSAVTIAFHVYWITWIGSWLPATLALSNGIIGGALLTALLLFIAFLLIRARHLVAAAVPLLIGSAAFLIALATTIPAPVIPQASAASQTGLLWLAPVCIFGFALCPYLDGTFLTARASLTAAQARFAFTLGFLVFFAAMIVATVLYTPLLLPEFGGRIAPQWLAALLLLHLLIQSAFTVVAHRRLSTLVLLPPSALIILILAAALAGMLVTQLPAHAGLDAGEIGYRAFMAFYGLVFPAYVWIAIIPGRRAPPRQTLRLVAAAVGIAAPMFWMGFIERQELWLAPGLLVVLLARLLLPRRAKLDAPA